MCTYVREFRGHIRKSGVLLYPLQPFGLEAGSLGEPTTFTGGDHQHSLRIHPALPHLQGSGNSLGSLTPVFTLHRVSILTH